MIARPDAGAVMLTLAAPACSSDAPPSSTLDLLIRGGLVVDGSGSEGLAADGGTWDGWVVRVGDLSAATAARTNE
jgi:hypothetical protein